MPSDASSADLQQRLRRLMSRPLFWLAALLVLVLLWFVLRTGEAAAWVTVNATRGDVERLVTAQGRIQPRNYVDVGAQVSGQLKILHVDVGDQVVKDQLLAEIDAAVQQARVEASRAQLDAQQAQLKQSQAQLTLAQRQFARQQKLRDADATSEDEFQIAQASVASAEAQVLALQAQIKQTASSLKEDEATLSYTRSYAPMDGIVASLTAREGVTLNANQTAPILMRIADLSVVTVETDVSEADVPRLRLGMPVYFSPIGDTEKRWHSSLRQILPTPQVLNNVVLFTALFDVDNPDGRLMSDMTAQVFFVEESAQDVVLVPVSALQKSGRDQWQVKVLEDGEPVLRDVQVGVSDRIHAEIRDGISEGDQVIVEGARAPGAGGARTVRPRGLF